MLPEKTVVTQTSNGTRARGAAGPKALSPTVYAELRDLAAAYLRRERPGHTLQATALVHEAYLKMMKQPGFYSRDRTSVVAMAAAAIRRILVDHARTRGRQKRGGERGRVPLVESAAVRNAPALDLLDLDAALDRLAEQSPERARIVEMRFFGGMSAAEIGCALNVSSRTVERDWRYARAWLYRELGLPGVDGRHSRAPDARDGDARAR